MSLSRAERRKLGRKRWADLVATTTEPEQSNAKHFGASGTAALRAAWAHRPRGDVTIAAYSRAEWRSGGERQVGNASPVTSIVPPKVRHIGRIVDDSSDGIGAPAFSDDDGKLAFSDLATGLRAVSA